MTSCIKPDLLSSRTPSLSSPFHQWELRHRMLYSQSLQYLSVWHQSFFYLFFCWVFQVVVIQFMRLLFLFFSILVSPRSKVRGRNRQFVSSMVRLFSISSLLQALIQHIKREYPDIA
jgi:hypothetical protein